MAKGQQTTKQIPAKKSGLTKAIAKPAKKAAQKKLINLSKIVAGEMLNCAQYMQVTKIVGDTVHLRTEEGKVIQIVKQIVVEDSYSADHFDRQVTCNMTELAEILNDAKDTIFRVNFRCQANQDLVFQKLKALQLSQLKDDAEIKKLTKSLTEGEETTLVAHLADGGQ